MRNEIEVNFIYRYSKETVEKLERVGAGDLSSLRFVVIKKVGADSYLVGIYSNEFKNSSKIVSVVIMYAHELLASMDFDVKEYLRDRIQINSFSYHPEHGFDIPAIK